MALPESLTEDSQPLFDHSPWLHQPRVLLASALAGSGLDSAGASLGDWANGRVPDNAPNPGQPPVTVAVGAVHAGPRLGSLRSDRCYSAAVLSRSAAVPPSGGRVRDSARGCGCSIKLPQYDRPLVGVDRKAFTPLDASPSRATGSPCRYALRPMPCPLSDGCCAPARLHRLPNSTYDKVVSVPVCSRCERRCRLRSSKKREGPSARRALLQ
jgi:hypothetical protein